MAKKYKQLNELVDDLFESDSRMVSNTKNNTASTCNKNKNTNNDKNNDVNTNKIDNTPSTSNNNTNTNTQNKNNNTSPNKNSKNNNNKRTKNPSSNDNNDRSNNNNSFVNNLGNDCTRLIDEANKINDIMNAARGNITTEQKNIIKKFVLDLKNVLVVSKQLSDARTRDVKEINKLRNELNLLKNTTQSISKNPVTYAMAASGSKPPVEQNTYKTIVESNSSKPAKDTLGLLKSKVMSSPLGISIVSHKIINNNKIIINHRNALAKQHFVKLFDKHSDIKITEQKKKYPVVLLKGVPQEIDNDQIIRMLDACNDELDLFKLEDDYIKFLFQRSNKKPTLKNVGLIVSPTIRNIMLNQLGGKVSIGFHLVHVEDSNPLIQCGHCLGFGHTSKVCASKARGERQTCRHCADNHIYKDCPNKHLEPTCSNCSRTKAPSTNRNHSATSVDCPKYIHHMKIARSLVDYGC